jgi:hypothetical protein
MRSGKSIEQALMAKGAYEKGKRVVLLTHRSKIFRSTLRHLSNAGIPCVDFTAGSHMPAGDWKVMLAMERTLWNVIRKSKKDSTGGEKFYNGVNNNGYDLADNTILQPNILLIDEIHLNNFSKIIDYFLERANQLNQKLFIVAFSGTPQGKHLHKYFTEIIYNVDSADLIASGDLVKCRAYQAQDDEIDLVKKDKGEFDSKEMFRHYDKPKRYAGLLKAYNEKVKGLKGICFCCNIEHTVKTYQAFKDAGVNSFMVHSGNDTYKMSEQEKEFMIREFESSHDGVMFNQGILDTGYDHPPMRWVAVDRATTSLNLWLQMASRGATPYPNKTEYILLDMGMNHTRHGLVHQPRTWSLIEKKRNKKLQPAPVKLCPTCSAMLPARTMLCEFCGHIFERPTTELKDGVMVEYGGITPISVKGKRLSQLTPSELIECQTTGKITSHATWRIARSKGEDFLTAYAKAKGYSNGWLWRHKNEMKDVTKIGFKDKIL